MKSTERLQRKQQWQRRKTQQRAFRGWQKAQGLNRRSHTTRPNRTSEYETVEQEREARSEATLEHARLLRAKLPRLLRELARIPDPRDPRRIRHKLTCLMLYGILMFVLQAGSRRKANELLSAPAMKQQLQQLFPELDTLPHHDTLYRLLAAVEPEGIQAAQVALVRSLMRDKKFDPWLFEGCYAIAIDGTQKLVCRHPADPQWLQRDVGSGESKHTQSYVYVLEANLVLSNGMSIPLMSEFLDSTQGDSERDKQDCEQRGFHRLAERLKKAFPHLRILLLLDGLFAVGPAMERCRRYGWHYPIVLQDSCLAQVWDEYRGLRQLAGPEEQHRQLWGDRRQVFRWVNDIQYTWGANQRKTVTLHLVVCEETWEELDEQGLPVSRRARHAWISDRPFTPKKIHLRCNLAARHRWSIEEEILVEKHQGFSLSVALCG